MSTYKLYGTNTGRTSASVANVSMSASTESKSFGGVIEKTITIDSVPSNEFERIQGMKYSDVTMDDVIYEKMCISREEMVEKARAVMGEQWDRMQMNKLETLQKAYGGGRATAKTRAPKRSCDFIPHCAPILPPKAHGNSLLNTMSVGEFAKFENGDVLKVRVSVMPVGHMSIPCLFEVDTTPLHSSFSISAIFGECPSIFLSQWNLEDGDRVLLTCKFPKMTHFNIDPGVRKHFMDKVVRRNNFNFQPVKQS